MFCQEEPLGLPELADRMLRLAADENQGRIQLTFLIERFDRLEGFRPAGYASTAKWLEARLDLSPGSARERVRVARAIRSLPLIAEAMASGEISYRRARTITRIATQETQAELLSLARKIGGGRLDEIVEARRAAATREDPEKQSLERTLTTRRAADGMVELVARLTPLDGAVVEKALRAAGKRVDVSTETPDDGRGRPLPDRRRALALVDVARRYLGASSARPRGEEYRILVHINGETGTARLHDGPQLSRRTVREILDSNPKYAWIVKGTDGWAYTKSVRTLSPALRELILGLDERCRFPGCRNSVFMHVHHKVHRRNGGGHGPANLVALCSHHHRVIHRPGYKLVEEPDGRIGVRTTEGYIPPDPALPERRRASGE